MLRELYMGILSFLFIEFQLLSFLLLDFVIVVDKSIS